MAIIEVRGLRKRYGRQMALDGVSLSVERGEIFGIPYIALTGHPFDL